MCAHACVCRINMLDDYANAWFFFYVSNRKQNVVYATCTWAHVQIRMHVIIFTHAYIYTVRKDAHVRIIICIHIHAYVYTCREDAKRTMELIVNQMQVLNTSADDPQINYMHQVCVHVHV